MERGRLKLVGIRIGVIFAESFGRRQFAGGMMGAFGGCKAFWFRDDWVGTWRWSWHAAEGIFVTWN